MDRVSPKRAGRRAPGAADTEAARGEGDAGRADTLSARAEPGRGGDPAHGDTIASTSDVAREETLLATGPADAEDTAGRRASPGIDLAVTVEAEGRYRLRHELAAGGQARVYVAYDTHLGREIALKQPRVSSDPGSGASRSALERFLRELERDTRRA